MSVLPRRVVLAVTACAWAVAFVLTTAVGGMAYFHFGKHNIHTVACTDCHVRGVPKSSASNQRPKGLSLRAHLQP
jgi:hypothetical protein